MDLDYAVNYCRRVGSWYYLKSPWEERHITTVEDWSQDLVVHLLSKIGAYDRNRPWKRWVHTIVVNRAITLLNEQWDAKRGLGCTPSVKSLVYTNIEGEAELVSTITPELEIIIFQGLTSKFVKEELSMANVISYDRVKELCEQFEKPYDSETDEAVLQSLVGVLRHVLNDMSDEDFQALDENTKTEVTELGAAVEGGKLKVQKSAAKTKRKGGGGGNKGRGVLKRVRELFAEGTQTVAEVTAVMDKENIVFAPASIRTEVGKLRKAAGMTRQPKTEPEPKTESKPKTEPEPKTESKPKTENKKVTGKIKEKGKAKSKAKGKAKNKK